MSNKINSVKEKLINDYIKKIDMAIDNYNSAIESDEEIFDLLIEIINFCIVSHAMAGDILCCFCILLMIFHWCHYMQFPLKSLVVVVIYVISYRSNQRASVIKTLFIIHFSF